jgi:hypothetical protein
MQTGSVKQGVGFAEGMTERPRQRQGVLALPARLLGLTGELERPGSVPQSTDGWVVVAVDGGERSVPVGIVEAHRPGRVISGGRQLTAREQSRPQRVMSLDQEARVISALG